MGCEGGGVDWDPGVLCVAIGMGCEGGGGR